MGAAKVALLDSLFGGKQDKEWASHGSTMTRQEPSVPGATYVKSKKPVDELAQAQVDPLKQMMALQMLMGQGGSGGGVNLNIGGGGGQQSNPMLPFMLSQLMSKKGSFTKAALSAFDEERDTAPPPPQPGQGVQLSTKGRMPSQYSQQATDRQRQLQFQNMGRFALDLGQLEFQKSRRGMSGLSQQLDDYQFQEDLYKPASLSAIDTMWARVKLADADMQKTLKQLTGGGTEQYAKQILKNLTPEHYQTARARGGDVGETLLNEIIPQQILFQHATRVGGGNPELGQSILDAYLKDNPASSGMGLKAILKEQLGPHLTGVSNAAVAEQLGEGGMESLMPQSQRFGRDEIMQMIEQHLNQTPGDGADVEPSAATPDVSAPGALPQQREVATGSGDLFGPGPKQAAIDEWYSHENLIKQADLASILSTLGEMGSEFAGAMGEHGQNIADWTGLSRLWGGGGGGGSGGGGAGGEAAEPGMLRRMLVGAAGAPLTTAALAGGVGLPAVRRLRSKAPSPQELGTMDRFMTPEGQPFKFSPENFQEVMMEDPSFREMARKLGPEAIAQMGAAGRPGMRGGFQRLWRRARGRGGELSAAQAALENISRATGGPAMGRGDIAKHLQGITGEGAGDSSQLIGRMLQAARAPAGGGQVSQTMGDTGGLGGLNVQSPAQATPYMMMHALRG